MKLHLTVGPSSSGKTTVIEQRMKDLSAAGHCALNLNRDDFRFAIFNNGVRDWSKYKFTKAREARVTKEILDIATSAALSGEVHTLFISDTNLNPAIRDKWYNFSEKYNCEFMEESFEASWDEIRARNIQRPGGIPETVLWNQHLKMCDYLCTGKYVSNGEPKAIIVDIDGTIAKVNGRGFFEWDKVGTDLPRKDVIAMVKAYAVETGSSIIFMSGRDGICRMDTIQWLNTHFSRGAWTLQMRKPGDMRKDYIVKRELYDSVCNTYDIHACFDDRPQVLRLWEELSIPTIINVGGSIHNEF